MALFGKKKQQNTALSVEKDKGTSSVSALAVADRDLSSVIVRQRITEKAMLSAEKNVYVFEVRRDATKYDIRDAVKKIWNVTPVRIRTVTKRPRNYLSRMRGNRTEKGLKKAYVYLKEGDRINV